MFVGEYGAEACGVGTFEELLNSAANAITFPDWVFDPNGYSGMNSSIDSMISGKQPIISSFKKLLLDPTLY